MLVDFKIRASACGKIMTGSIGATPSQFKFIEEMEGRKSPMTDIMRAKYDDYIYVRDNPELPQGAKSYCQEWLKGQLYGTKEISSKYIEKGLAMEDQAIEYLYPHLQKNKKFFDLKDLF